MRIPIDPTTRLFVDVDGARLRPEGSTMRTVPTILLLHGGPGFDHSSFKPAFAELTDFAQLVYVDHRGMGRSDRGGPQDWHLEQWADDVVSLCEVLGIERPVVLGQSFGGFVALAYAERHPNHPAALILSSTAAHVTRTRVLAEFQRLGGLTARNAARDFFEQPSERTWARYQRDAYPFYTQTPRDPGEGKRRVLRIDVLLHHFRHEHPTMDMRPDLTRIRCPVLVIAGEHDPITPVADAADILAGLTPGLGRMEILPGAGHGVFRDRPDEYFELVKNFVASLRTLP